MNRCCFMRQILSTLCVAAIGSSAVYGFAQEKRAAAPSIVIEADGTVEAPARNVALSSFLSPEAKAYVTQHLEDMQNPEMLKSDNGVPRFMKHYLDRDTEMFPLDRKDDQIAGVHVYD